MRFGYHNHDFEFTQMMGTETMYEVMLNNTDPTMVTQQFDMGNLYGTGADALAIVKKYPGRFVSMHVKDEIKRANGNGYESTILGKGVQQVKEIVEEGLKNGGTIHLIVEQEAYQGITPLECIKEDFKVMKQWGFKGQ
jgi:sugar phosphate isomerase/epimerase